MKKRLGVVSYLNTKPIMYGIETGRVAHDFILSYDVPSACARDLREGRMDAALIPSIEYAAREDYFIVPDICISSCGPVESVILYLNGDVREVDSVALDESSLTSVALTKIVLQERYGTYPRYVRMEPNLSRMMLECSAALVIGDNPLMNHVSPESKMDMGKEWTDWTGFPFVFAFWAGRRGGLAPADVRALIRSTEMGVKSVGEIAQRACQQMAMDKEKIGRYLTRNIGFKLGEREIMGLRLFYEKAHGIGLIERVPELRFYEERD